MRFVEPITLTGSIVTLEPLERRHEDAVRTAANDGEVWRLWFTSVPPPDAVARYIDGALGMRESRGAMPFVVRENASGDVIGCTRYCNVEPEHRRLEIGYTWYSQRAQRTGVNTECKLLMLSHAFEQLNCIAVEFRTSWFNQASRRAIERLGAKQDGVLRNHQVMPDGTLRDTAVFSIIAGEWPAVRRHLRYELQRPR